MLTLRLLEFLIHIGPFMQKDDGRVISNFIIQALKNDDITIYGDGTQTRSFQYIDDLIDAMLKMIKTNNEINGPINIGNPIEYNMNELAEIIIKLTNSKSRIIYKDLPSDDPKKRKPDITLANDILDWKPFINLKDGLNKTINYFNNII